ncbi:pyruvate carboxyltransferase [Desulfobulbus sp. F5]|nr:pyruvate carboxyltransferase [Desulfobulbus sp. F5]
MSRCKLIDSTLREGAQAPGVAFTAAARLRIIAGLSQAGIDEIELGAASPLHPWLPELLHEARDLVAQSCSLALWCRCKDDDIAFAAACHPDVLSLSIPVSDRHIRERLRKDRSWVRETLIHSIELALSLGIPSISVGLEDASRAELDFVCAMATTAAQHGASRIRLADTVGICSPGSISELVLAVKGAVSLPVGVHCHNDFGMATANSIAALEAGANSLDATVLGLGERTGCCRLEEAVGYLALVQGNRRYKPEHLPALCHTVAEAAGRKIAANHPLVGADIFTCETGLHQHGLAVNPATYEPYPPERVGSTRTLRFGQKTGFRAVALHLAKHGLHLTESEIQQLTKQVRACGAVLNEGELLRFAVAAK